MSLKELKKEVGSMAGEQMQQGVRESPPISFVEVREATTGGKIYVRPPDGTGIRRYVHDIEGELEQRPSSNSQKSEIA